MAGASVAALNSMPFNFHDRLHELRADWRAAATHHPRVLGAVVVLFATLAVASVAGSVRFLENLHEGLPDETVVTRIGEMNQATVVFDSSDSLAFTIFKEQRIEVPLSEVSPNLIHALVAIEDQHFYEHHGYDAVRIASAALANIRHRRVAQGGSTITQQLARQSFLTPDKTIRRKVQELILASRIERMYSKPQILAFYLNKVYFGDGLYGIEAASRGYFGKHASDLTVAEAALLAGLVKSPSSYAPTVSLSWGVAGRARRTRGAQGQPSRSGAARPILQRAGAPRPGRSLRLAARVPRRPARVFHHRHEDAGGGRIGGGRIAQDDRRETSGARRATQRCEAGQGHGGIRDRDR
jgi:hypothetical protein